MKDRVNIINLGIIVAVRQNGIDEELFDVISGFEALSTQEK